MVLIALILHLKCGPGEEQGNRLINSGFCNISGCEVYTSVPVKCDTSYDCATNYADKCRNVCHRDCAKEAGLISELDDTLLYVPKTTMVINIVMKKSKMIHQKETTITTTNFAAVTKIKKEIVVVKVLSMTIILFYHIIRRRGRKILLFTLQRTF